ncbi:MAG: diguanylate cyclase domain-containing protein [Kiloniellaceae bacterium]
MARIAGGLGKWRLSREGLKRVFDGKQRNADRANDFVVIQEGLDTLHIGLSIFDAGLRLLAFNQAYLTLLQFPPELGRLGTPLEAFFRFSAERGEYGEGDIGELVEQRLALARKFEPHSYHRRRLDGTVIEVTGRPLASGGFVSSYTDITDVVRAREAVEAKEQEMTRHLEDIDLERAMVEQQAQQMVHMAEDLALRNKEIEKSRAESDFQARHDVLTGLPNRRYFVDYLDQVLSVAASAGASKALFFVDLDNFKPVNDQLGHDHGDKLLRKVALRLTSSVRDSDFVARLGGDEFAVIAAMKPENGVNGVRMVAERILESLSLTVEGAEPPITIAASIGIALYPTDADDREGLLRAADTAMYEAKGAGRNRIVFASEIEGAKDSR